MLLISASLKQSPIHGFGCFTDEPIKKGQVVWIFNDRIDLRIPLADLETLPPPAQTYWRIYGYVEEYQSQETIVLCGDHSKHMNHSDTPNLLDSKEQGGINIAARDIVVGEELTCNYHLFDLEAGAKLGRS